MNTPSSAPCQPQTKVANTCGGWVIGRGNKRAWVQTHQMEAKLHKDGWGKYLEEDSSGRKKEGCPMQGVFDGTLGRIFFKLRENYFGFKPVMGCRIYEGNIPLKVWRKCLKGMMKGQMKMRQTVCS